MDELANILSRHPLSEKPYNAIRLVRIDYFGTPIYRVARDPREGGAAKALKIAFELYGAHCFHCGSWMPPQPLSYQCTRDHVRARAENGSDLLHNLVFACGHCNADKGKRALIDCSVERGDRYLRALENHLVRCMQTLCNAERERRLSPQSVQV